MELHIKYTNISPLKAIDDYIRKKIDSLKKLISALEVKKVGSREAIHVFLEVGKSDRHHQKGRVWYAECQIYLPKRNIRSVSNHYDLRAAIDEVKDEMKHLIEDYKEKQGAKRKRGFRQAKRKTRFAPQAQIKEKSRVLYE